jgi:hypothetical protein
MLKVANFKKKRKVLTLQQKRNILLGLKNEIETVNQMGKAFEVDSSNISDLISLIRRESTAKELVKNSTMKSLRMRIGLIRRETTAKELEKNSTMKDSIRKRTAHRCSKTRWRDSTMHLLLPSH